MFVVVRFIARSKGAYNRPKNGFPTTHQFIYSKTYNYLDTVGEVTNLASGGGTELPLSEIASQ